LGPIPADRSIFLGIPLGIFNVFGVSGHSRQWITMPVAAVIHYNLGSSFSKQLPHAMCPEFLSCRWMCIIVFHFMIIFVLFVKKVSAATSKKHFNTFLMASFTPTEST
jgi:hypothetical protein